MSPSLSEDLVAIIRSCQSQRPPPKWILTVTQVSQLIVVGTKMRTRLVRLLLLVWIGGAACALTAVEKYWIARNAKTIVVGRLQDVWSFPWFDGWHFRGTISVNELLVGNARSGERLRFRFVCACCPLWPRPDIKDLARNEGIWFLTASGDGTWKSAGDCSDPGYRPVSEIEAFRSMLAKFH